VTGMASTDKIEVFLAERRNAVVAGIRRDGRPHLSPNWFCWDGQRFYVSTTRSRVKYAIFPRAQLLMDDPTGFRAVLVPATVEIREDIAAELPQFRAIREKYGMTVPDDAEHLRALAEGSPAPIAALDTGVPVRDVQEAASHADPRTTMRSGESIAGPARHLHRRGLSPNTFRHQGKSHVDGSIWRGDRFRNRELRPVPNGYSAFAAKASSGMVAPTATHELRSEGVATVFRRGSAGCQFTGPAILSGQELVSANAWPGTASR
jgi:hypothetical protein